MSICLSLSLYIYIYIYTHTCIHVYTCVCIYIYIYTYIYIYIYTQYMFNTLPSSLSFIRTMLSSSLDQPRLRHSCNILLYYVTQCILYHSISNYAKYSLLYESNKTSRGCGTPAVALIWGFNYTFTNYNFRQVF